MTEKEKWGEIRITIFEGDPITRFINQKIIDGYGALFALQQHDSLDYNIIDTLDAEIVLVDFHLESALTNIVDLPRRIRQSAGNKTIVVILAVVLTDYEREALSAAGYNFCWLKPLSLNLVDHLVAMATELRTR